MRLFVAIYPDEATQAWIAESQRHLQKELARFHRELRWVAPDAIHVTLVFLGEIPESAPIEQALETCHVSAMELTVAGLGVFPNLRRPNVLWTGVEDPAGALARLQTELSATLVRFVEPERRRFEPHLTLARIKPGSHAHLSTAIKTLSRDWGSAPEPWRVKGFSLMQSELGSAGARHSVVRTF